MVKTFNKKRYERYEARTLTNYYSLTDVEKQCGENSRKTTYCVLQDSRSRNFKISKFVCNPHLVSLANFLGKDIGTLDRVVFETYTIEFQKDLTESYS